MSDKCEMVPVAAGLSVSFGSDGHWLNVEAPNGRKASINLETFLPVIARSAFISWADEVLDRAAVHRGEQR